MKNPNRIKIVWVTSKGETLDLTWLFDKSTKPQKIITVSKKLKNIIPIRNENL